MYENQTFEEILSRMLDKLSNEIDKREGSVAYDMLAPKALELSLAYGELDNVLLFGFAGTTYGEYLEMKVAEAGITRLPALKAQGTITLTSDTDGLVIAQGEIVQTELGQRFLTDSQVTITNGTASVNITAEVGGIDGNVPANSITIIGLSEITCTNAQPTTGGQDAETDALLLDRYYKKVQAPGVSGNKYHYLQWAMDIQGIGNARILPLWNGNGTVKVILINTDKEPVAAAKVQEVYDHIQEVRPIGPTVTVESAVKKFINIDATLSLQSGYAIEDVQPSIEQQINAYFKEATFVDTDIKLSKIGTIILTTPGVVDYSGLQLNEGTSNIILLDTEIPGLGTVTFT